MKGELKLHRQSVTEALLGTVLVFNTVFEIPPDMGLFTQIFGCIVVFMLLLTAIEKAREWEHQLRKKKVRRAATQTDK